MKSNRSVNRWSWIAPFALALLFLFLLYRSLYAADFTAHVTANGKPLAGAWYDLYDDGVRVPDESARALIGGKTDSTGSISIRNISTGTWTLQVGCVAKVFELGEVNAAVQMEVDASCYPMVYLTAIVK